MKCSRITLYDRKEKSVNNKLNQQRHPCYYERSYQPELQNYLSWLNKPHSIHEDEQQYLTICNIVLPFETTVFVDRGALSSRWINKRPRLKSAKQKKDVKHLPVSPNDSENEEREEIDNQDEKDSEITEMQQILQEYEIDDNVHRLIQEAAEYDRKVEEEIRDINNQENPKTKTKKNNMKKKSRSLSLSRPPSPETIQVIRVDVISNYSLEGVQSDVDSSIDGEVTECPDTGTERNRLHSGKSAMKIREYTDDLPVLCHKVELLQREI